MRMYNVKLTKKQKKAGITKQDVAADNILLLTTRIEYILETSDVPHDAKMLIIEKLLQINEMTDYID